METLGEAIPFIEIVDDKYNENPTTRFEVNSKALSFLASLKEKQVSVVCIAGPQRTGKSFLANRLLKSMKGFSIGPTTNPCTKGIWIWNTPIRIDDRTDMLIIDTEGLHSTQRDETIDMKIFSLSILLCSMFIYNQLGHIDEQALENLSLVVNLSHNIKIDKEKDSESDLSDFCPYFFWVLRDFSLDLKGKDPKNYLEDVLRAVPGEGKDMERKNLIREKLRSYFKKRDCQCLVRPVAEESKLARIEDQKWEELRPQFIQGVYDFETKVFQNLQPKIIKNKTLTGEMFLKLTFEYIEAINNGGVPQILTSVERVISSEIRKVMETCKAEYDKQSNLLLNENEMPFDGEDLITTHNKITQDIENMLIKYAKDIIDSSKMLELKEELKEKMQKDYYEKEQLNSGKSQTASKNLLYSFLNGFKVPVVDNIDNLKITLLKEKNTDLNNFLAQYNKKAKGPSKYKIINDHLPSFLFSFFENFYEMMQRLYTDDHNKTKVYLAQAREGEDRLRKSIKDYESLVLELQKERESLKHEIESLERESEKKLKFKDLEIEELSSQLEELCKSKDSKKKKMTNLNTEMSDLQVTIRKLNAEINEKNIENAGLLKKISEFEKLMKMQSSNLNLEFSPEIVNLVKELKQHVFTIEEFHRKRAIETNSQQNHLKELEELREDKFNQINRLREKHKSKCEEIKSSFEKENNLIKKRFEVLNKYNDDLKEELMELQKKVEAIEKKDIQIKCLLQENQKLNETLTHSSSNLETHIEILERYNKQIEKLTNIQLELEQKLGIVNSEKSNLFSYKETFPYVLKESLKWAAGKKSNLKHSLRSLGEEDFSAIKGCFEEAGFNLNI